MAAWMADDHELRAKVALEAESRLRSVAPLEHAAATLLAAAHRVNEAPLTPRAEDDVRVTRARIAIGQVVIAPPPLEGIYRPASSGH